MASFRDKATAGLNGWRIPDPQRDDLLGLMGSPSGVTDLASDLLMRGLVADHLVGQMLALHYAMPGLHFYMATIIDDTVRTKDLRCSVSFKRLVKSTHGMLAYAGVSDWFGIEEVQPYVNWEAKEGRDIAPHLHIIFWSDGPLSRKARARMTRCHRFESFTGAPVVRITERVAVDGELAQMINYLLKPPERGANLVPARLRPSLSLTDPPVVEKPAKQFDASIRNDLAIRLLEMLSQLRLSKMLVSGGDGKRITGVVRQFIRASRTIGMDVTAIAGQWAAARREAGKDQYTAIRLNDA